MYRNMLRNTTVALGALLMSSTLVLAGGLPGAVTALDGKGMATVHTTDGKDHQVKAAEGLKVGAKVECEARNSQMECHPVAAQAAVTPTPSTPATTPTKPAPAPTAVTPAPAAVTPAPSTATPAPASK